MINIQLQQVLEAIGTAAAALGNVANDVDNGGEDIAIAICQQSRSLDVIHLGNLLVQLDETNTSLTTGNGDQAFLDNGTVIRLEERKPERLDRAISKHRFMVHTDGS